MKWVLWFKCLPLGWEPNINQIGLLVQVSSLEAVSFKSMEWPFILLLVVGVVVALALKNRGGNGKEDKDSSSNGNHVYWCKY